MKKVWRDKITSSQIKMGTPRILLLNPKFPDYKVKLVERHNRIWQPISLGIIASMLETQGRDFVFLDANALGYNVSQILRKIESVGPNIVVLNTAQHDRWQNPIPSIKGIAKLTREFTYLKKKPILVLIGPFGTVFPDQTLKDIPYSDFIVRGEPEVTTVELINGIIANSYNNIPGISYRRGNKYFHTPDRGYIKDLDDLPFPAYHLMPMQRYHHHKSQNKDSNHRFAMVITSRGCPFKCVFCNLTMLGNRYRVRSVSNIINEIDLLVKIYGVNFIMFHDLVFTLRRGRAIQICEQLIQRKYDLTWRCQSRGMNLDVDLLRKMKEAGCVAIEIGIEAPTEEVQSNIKHIPLHKLVESVQNARALGFDIYAGHMLGLPGQSYASEMRSAELFHALGLSCAITSTTTPYPGTELYNQGIEEGKIIPNSWDSIVEATGRVGNDLDRKTLLQIRRTLQRKEYILQLREGMLRMIRHHDMNIIRKIYGKLKSKI
ncbi:B12-binding domain-containing radical SAM protein [Chloroflexota bacterium]